MQYAELHLLPHQNPAQNANKKAEIDTIINQIHDTKSFLRVGGGGRRNAGQSWVREGPKAAQSHANKENRRNGELPEKLHRQRASIVARRGGELNREVWGSTEIRVDPIAGRVRVGIYEFGYGRQMWY